VLTYSANKLSSVLEYDGFEERRHLVTGEEEATHFQSVYFKLGKHLRALKSLPLGVTDVLGVGPACRNTKVSLGLVISIPLFSLGFQSLTKWGGGATQASLHCS